MKKDEQLKWAIGLALAIVIVVIQFGYFSNPQGASSQSESVDPPEWEAARIRADLPDADFVYVLSTCPPCRVANQNVEFLEKSHPQFKFLWIHPSMVNLPALMETLGGTYGIDDPALRETTPVLYGPARAWVGVPEVAGATLEDAVDGVRPFERMGASWEWLRYGQSEVVRRFQQYRWYMIAIAGLIDGINPCAIAAIIFLLSYLTLSGMRQNALKVGVLFALGSFITYFLIGAGLWRLADIGLGAYWGRRIIYPAIAFITLTVALLAFIEFFQLLRSNSSDTVLKLPQSWVLRVHEIVRRVVRGNRALLLALPMGVVVTLIEFGCTGQVYLPTITYVSSLPGGRLTVVPVLLVYNLAHIHMNV
jgi:cytochrome c biogenesis protein CcdA